MSLSKTSNCVRLSDSCSFDFWSSLKCACLFQIALETILYNTIPIQILYVPYSTNTNIIRTKPIQILYVPNLYKYCTYHTHTNENYSLSWVSIYIWNIKACLTHNPPPPKKKKIIILKNKNTYNQHKTAHFALQVFYLCATWTPLTQWWLQTQIPQDSQATILATDTSRVQHQ